MIECVDNVKVKHLSDNLYKVHISKVKFADKKDAFGFCNPRLMSVGDIPPKGLSKEEMFELSESIRTEGLHHPLQLRHVSNNGESILQLVNGERRTRALRKLIKDKAICYDPVTKSEKTADVLYEFVCAYVEEMDDETAFKQAFSANDRAIGIGEVATVALVGALRQANFDDKKIMNITGKSITWLKDTDALLKLDEATYGALAAEQINRSAALDLAKIDNAAERMQVLEMARNFAVSRLENVKKKLEKEVKATLSKADMAKATAAEAKFQGDLDTVAEAVAKAEQLESKAEAKKAEKIEVENNGVTVTGKDLQKAKQTKAKNEGDDSISASLTDAKLKKFWYEPCLDLIKANFMDENGEPLELDANDVYLVKLLLEQKDKGQTNIVKILKHHLKKKDQR